MTQQEFITLANKNGIFTAMWIAKYKGIDGMQFGGKVMKAYVAALLASYKK